MKRGAILLAALALLALAGNAAAVTYGAITVYKWNDTDADGVKDRTEKGMAGSFTVNGSNGFLKTVSISPKNLLYTVIVPVPSGAVYTVTENLPADYASTVKNPKTVLIKKVCKCPYDACGLAPVLKYGAKYSPVPPEKYLTAENLRTCMRSNPQHPHLLSIDPETAGGASQMAVFDYEGSLGQDLLAEITNFGSTFDYPVWEYYRDGIFYSVPGCRTFPDLNGMFGCGLVNVSGHVYKSC